MEVYTKEVVGRTVTYTKTQVQSKLYRHTVNLEMYTEDNSYNANFVVYSSQSTPFDEVTALSQCSGVVGYKDASWISIFVFRYISGEDIEIYMPLDDGGGEVIPITLVGTYVNDEVSEV